MTPADVRRMVGMIRAIRAGKWTDELPQWAKRTMHPRQARGLQLIAEGSDCELRAVQTAEAFIMLAHGSDMRFDEHQFLLDCGFVG